ncbi:MAG: 1,4-dihydroxy-6-naphthoate synthase [Planctomycetota bacterium]
MDRLRVGISTCPNDTFAFHALLTGAHAIDGVALDFTLADVQELNEGAAAGAFEVVKVSYAAVLGLTDRYRMLSAGSALGFGVGPVVLGRADGPDLDGLGPDARVLAPGAGTTAHLLWQLFHPGRGRLEQQPFFEIMPALEAGRADAGVCIHEGRFTWRERGLTLLEDLGQTWEQATQAPLPLGGIAIARTVPEALAQRIAGAVRTSIEAARRDPQPTLATMRQYAQEHSDAVLWQHVDLYVNDQTVDLGPSGRRAVEELARRARERGLLPNGATLEVVEPQS